MGCGSSKLKSTSSSTTYHNNKLIQSINYSGNVRKKSVTKLSKTKSKTKTFKLEDRVHVRGYIGTVKFVGQTGVGGSKEDWIGIELDRKHEQGNDGSFQGVQYFKCGHKHGMFAKPSIVQLCHDDIGDIDNTWQDISPQTLIFIQTRIRRFLSNLRLRKLEARSGIEREIDKHVLTTPQQKTTTVNLLSEYLTTPWADERKKALAIYRWMTLNIAYDTEGFFGKASKKNCDAESVLKNRTCVCSGYANLFEALCKAAELEALTVVGYAKGYGYDPKQKFVKGKTNHAWNLLKANGKWYICEVTWGAGHVGDDLMFVRDPNLSYFLMDPEYAITDHFPLHAEHQLLDKPISKEDFEKLVVPSTDFVSMGVEVVSHPICVNQTHEDHARIQFYAPQRTVIMGQLKHFGSGEKVEPRNFVQIRPSAINQLTATVQFPRPDEYKVEFSVLVEGKWKFGIRYIFNTSKGIGEAKGGFPLINQELHTNGFELESPLENIMTNTGKAAISLRCYNSRFSHVTGSLIKLKSKTEELKQEHCLCLGFKQESGFLLRVHLPEPGEYKLNIFAKKFVPGSSLWLCTYFIHSSRGMTPIAGFPYLSQTFSSWNLELEDTLQNVFTEDGRVSIKLRTPGDINIRGYLKLFEPETNLGNHLCFVQKSKDKSEILVHTPDPGLYKLVIMGTKEPGGKQEYLCSYKIKSSRGVGVNAGFVTVSKIFKALGLEIKDQIENILTEDGRVKVKVRVQSNVAFLARLNQHNKDLNHELCFVEDHDDSTKTIFAHTPTPGIFKLNVFARSNLESRWDFVFSFFVESQSAVKHPGFAQLSDDFVAWGLKLESSFESILIEDGEAVIVLDNPTQVRIKAWLYDDGNTQQPNSCVLISELGQNKTMITCGLPKKGHYHLNVFGAKENNQGSLSFLMKHNILYM